MPSRSLRNPAINYGDGWFFVTAQVAHNKSQFGVIAGGRCELNELGRRVVAVWRNLPTRFPSLRQDAFVVMPNPFHAASVWHGAIRPGGTLETLLRSLPLSPPQSPHPHHSSLS